MEAEKEQFHSSNISKTDSALTYTHYTIPGSSQHTPHQLALVQMAIENKGNSETAPYQAKKWLMQKKKEHRSNVVELSQFQVYKNAKTHY